jgi:hypothetical protein
MKKPLTASQRWYRRMKAKLGKAFLRHRAALQRKSAKKHQTRIKAYQKEYHKDYYRRNKTVLDAYMKVYRTWKPDHTRKKRVRKYWKKQRDQITDKYLKKLARGRELNKMELEERRQRIIRKRQLKPLR